MRKENWLIVGLAATAAVAAAFWLLLVAPGFTGNEINMPRGVTPQSENHYDLHMIILWVCVVIGILVFAAMFTSIFLHRKSRGVKPAQFTHSTKAEIIWTVIPVLILVVMAIPATMALVESYDTSESDMTVKVTGFQWKWKYEYPEHDIEFISALDAESNAARQVGSNIDPTTVDNYLLNVDKPLVLPTGKKIKFLITADDVIHAWWVPDFGWKKDAIPGFINDGWVVIQEEGTYRGQCAELCGKDHGFMPIVVEAVSEAEFDRWVATQRSAQATAALEADRLWTRDELMRHGETVYAQQCASCHQPNGEGLKPAFPALAGSDVTTGPVAAHIDIVLNGIEGSAMPAWSDTLNEVDIAAALTYTRNAFGNESGDVVQPRTIVRIKNG